jgi:hypothetical protein
VRRRRRDGILTFSLSFLDAVSCGFGAIVLLLVLTKIGEPSALEQARLDLDGLIVRLERELAELKGETAVLERQLVSRREQLSEERQRIARLRGDLESIRGEYAATRQLSEVQEIIEGRLLAAQQELSEEMRRLQERQRYRRPRADAEVGGIPVDSEYIVFIVDTSGSMFNYAWPEVNRKMDQVLDAYPAVKGLQVINDMGQFMFTQYAGKWIPDTPARRRAILERLRTWNAFSNSSPVEGITAAIRTFAASDKQISLYVFGDEFSGVSIDQVVRTVDRINRPNADGDRPVRVHAIGFPTVFKVAGAGEHTGVRFATLMRILCRRNGGTFVGLSSLLSSCAASASGPVHAFHRLELRDQLAEGEVELHAVRDGGPVGADPDAHAPLLREQHLVLGPGHDPDRIPLAERRRDRLAVHHLRHRLHIPLAGHHGENGLVPEITHQQSDPVDEGQRIIDLPAGDRDLLALPVLGVNHPTVGVIDLPQAVLGLLLFL